jgi:hypothetical protein
MVSIFGPQNLSGDELTDHEIDEEVGPQIPISEVGISGEGLEGSEEMERPKKRAKKTTLYVVQFNLHAFLFTNHSQPKTKCSRKIKEAGIRYSAGNEEIGGNGP